MSRWRGSRGGPSAPPSSRLSVRHRRDSVWSETIAAGELLQPQSARKRSQRRWPAPAVLVGAVAVTAVVLLAAPQARRAVVLATTHQPTPYTELFFAQPDTLSGTYRPGVVQNLTFGIRNHEGRAMDYTYDVRVDGRRVGQPQHVAVRDGEGHTVRRGITLGQSTNRVLVEVLLVTTGQSIHYWTSEVT